MKNLKFWQKTYLLTLALFIVCLCAGVFFIGFLSQRREMENEKSKAVAQQNYIAQRLAYDMDAVPEGNSALLQKLFASYGGYYAENGAALELRTGNETVFSNLPGYEGERKELMVSKGEKNVIVRKVDKGRYMYVTSFLPGPFEEYVFTCAFDLEELTAAWNSMVRWYISGCLAVSAVLAVLLYFVLRKLSKPIESLAVVADSFGSGELSARAASGGNDEIGDLSKSFNNMADAMGEQIKQLREAAEQKERLADNLSHEIRTPLTAVQGYAEYILLSNPSEEERNEALGYILEESRRLRMISQSLLRMSVIRHEKIELVPLDFSDACQYAHFTIKPKSDASGVTVSANIDPGCKIMGDKALIESLVINLLDNAVKACHGGGEVWLALKRDGGGIRLSVRDSGRGMSADELRMLGEPFYRSDKARSRSMGGAGLGVALCFQIAELHGAELIYESEPGKGTTATVTFTALQ